MLAVAYATGRASHARQVKNDDPDKKGYPGPPGWGFGMGLTTPHSKKPYCYESWTKERGILFDRPKPTVGCSANGEEEVCNKCDRIRSLKTALKYSGLKYYNSTSGCGSKFFCRYSALWRGGGVVLYSHSLKHVLLTEGMLLRCHHPKFFLLSDLCST
jgi:hypothetical protein